LEKEEGKVMHDGAWRRKGRMETMIDFAKQNPGIPQMTFIGRMAFDLGLSEARVKEYLRILTGAGILYVEEGKVYFRSL